MISVRKAVLAIVLASAGILLAQTPKLEPQQPASPAIPTITFTFDWPSIQPHHYFIAVDSTGRAAYQSLVAEGTAGQSIEGEPYMVKFVVSEAMRTRIFELAKQVDYFRGDFDFKKRRVAFSGTKTLAYKDNDKNIQTSYNWSENPAIQELTNIFEGISNTQESARRLTQLRRFDKLGLDEELKHMEELANNHALIEVQSIAPLLQQLASDPSVMHIARQRAQRLLQLTQPSTQAP